MGCSHHVCFISRHLFFLFLKSAVSLRKADDQGQLLGLGCSLRFGLPCLSVDEAWPEEQLKAWVNEVQSIGVFASHWSGIFNPRLGNVFWIYIYLMPLQNFLLMWTPGYKVRKGPAVTVFWANTIYIFNRRGRKSAPMHGYKTQGNYWNAMEEVVVWAYILCPYDSCEHWFLCSTCLRLILTQYVIKFI